MCGCRCLPAGEAARKCALKSILEGFPEVTVEVSVDKGIERRIEVSDPEEDGDNDIWTVTGFTTQRRDDVPVDTEVVHIGRDIKCFNVRK